MNIEELYKIYLAHPEVTTDSRECPQGALFFALKGDNFNGNLFASKAIEAGCAYAIIDEPEAVEELTEQYIVVEDVLKALQELAHYHREQFHGPVIEITGTNGKTTTKELLTAVLQKKYNVLSTIGNLNNHIGVPRTLLRLKPFVHQIAIIETGANHPGEIAFLANMVNPTCGLITNVGKAHLEGFGSFEGVIHTKGELYDKIRQNTDRFIFIDADNPHLKGIANGLPQVSYGKPCKDSHNLVEGEVVACAPFLTIQWRKTGETEWNIVKTHLIGAYNLCNLLAAACVGVKYGVSTADITEALANYTPTNSRSEFRQTPHNQLIVDAYNANPSSMEAAIKNFALIESEHKMVILGDMRELGATSLQEHQKVVNMLQELGNLEEAWLVGENFQKVASTFRCFNNVEEVKEVLQQTPIENKLILIKGSNGTKLFQLPALL